jgi:WD40 repeat protein
VKAGLLPRLAKAVTPVYLEATGDETEARLLKGLRRQVPHLPGNLGLIESLSALRRGRFLASGQKVLLVLDQFEQWLHAKRNEENTELVQALRHCDGGQLQCVVMVRDDFWLAVSRFMQALEIRVVEGENSRLVDLFDLLHARKVLAAFGRAYGRLPDNLGQCSKEQDAFLDQAVAGLAQEGEVISVRLALFAEMVKGKPWTPSALKEVGGTEGVGVTFLEETFTASTAPPQHRLHQKAAQAVLKALLPEVGTDIRGHIWSQQELLDASGYAIRPKDFDNLLGILDSEIRLITPTDPEGKDEGERAGVSSPSKGTRYYQLTHDYLVPSLRDWLTRKQKETRRGRAELFLADRAGVWNSRPENRQLPTILQWFSIRWLTQGKNWTPPQRKMMRKATRYHAVRGAAAISVALIGFTLLAALAVGYEKKQRAVAEEKARDQKREVLIQRMALLRMMQRTEGWSRRADRLVEEAGEIRRGEDLQTQAAANLYGMDAVQLPGLDKEAGALVFDSTGKRLLLAGTPKRVNHPGEPAKVWDTETGELTVSKQPGEGPVAFAPDGTPLLLVAKSARTLLLWDLAKQQAIREFTFPDQIKVDSAGTGPIQLALSPDGFFVAAGATAKEGKGAVVVWEAASGKLQWRLNENAEILTFSPDHSLLATCDENGRLTIWGATTGERLAVFSTGRLTVQSLAFTPSSKWSAENKGALRGRLAVGDEGGSITIWDLAEKKPVTFCHGCTSHLYALTFSPDGTILASSGRNFPMLWDSASGALVLSFVEAADYNFGLAFTPDGKKLAYSTMAFGRVTLWSLENGRGQQTLRGLVGRISKEVRFSPDGKLLAALSHRWQVAVWDIATSRLQHLFNVPKGEYYDNAALAFRSDNRQLAFSTGGLKGSTAKLWDLGTGRELNSWNLPPGLGDVLAFPSSDKLLLFRFETADGKVFPDSDADPSKHPRVCRIRNLLDKEPRKPALEITDFNWHVSYAVSPPDGSYFLVLGRIGQLPEVRWMIKAFDGLTGRELWSIQIGEVRPDPAEVPADPAIDPTGTFARVFVGPKDRFHPLLLEMPSGKLIAQLVDGDWPTLSPHAKYLLRGKDALPGSSYGFSLIRREDDASLLTVDTPNRSGHYLFSKSGAHLAWGNKDGTVTVCDLKELNRRLTPLGFGW